MISEFPLKILLVTEDVPAAHLGGAGKHAVLLGNALIEAGHQVEILGIAASLQNSTKKDFQGILHTEIDFSRTGLKAVAMGIFNPVRNLLMAWRVWCAIKHVDYKRFDVIHYHGHIAEVGLFVPKSVNFVHTLHDQASECLTHMRFKNGRPCQAKLPSECAGCAAIKPNALQKAVSTTAVMLHRYHARKAFTRHKAIFVSDFLRSRFVDIVGHADELNVTVVHNFTDTRLMANVLQQMPIRLSRNSSPIVLIAGRVHLTKGQDVFLQALSNETLKEIEVRIVGDGPDLAKLKQKHEARGVKFLGWQSQEDVYRESIQADICIVPSIWEEAFGTTTLEGLVFGKLVFALSRGATPELMRYCVFPNQLRLFSDMASLVEAIASIKSFGHLSQTYKPLTLGSADVRARLPEILDVYIKSKINEFEHS
jgi:glycogen synthase